MRRLGLDANNVNGIEEGIKEKIQINHISYDRTFTSARRRVRVRGKEVKIYDSEGTVVADKWTNGRTVRAQLHKDTIFGAINNPEIAASGAEQIIMVVRKNMADFESLKDLDVIINPVLRNHIISVVKQAEENGVPFKTAIQNVYPRGKDGSEVKFDRNGRPLRPIRHVRCKVKAGRGFMTCEKSIPVKEHAAVYKSNKEYRHHYYMQNDGNYLFLLYEGIGAKGKLKRTTKIISYFDATQYGLTKSSDVNLIPGLKRFVEKGVQYTLKYIIKRGTRLIMKTSAIEDVRTLSPEELSMRLFVVNNFNNTGSDVVYANNHLEARSNENIPKEEKDLIAFVDNKYIGSLKLTQSNLNCLVEGYDFIVNDIGQIEFTK